MCTTRARYANTAVAGEDPLSKTSQAQQKCRRRRRSLDRDHDNPMATTSRRHCRLVQPNCRMCACVRCRVRQLRGDQTSPTPLAANDCCSAVCAFGPNRRGSPADPLERVVPLAPTHGAAGGSRQCRRVAACGCFLVSDRPHRITGAIIPLLASPAGLHKFGDSRQSLLGSFRACCGRIRDIYSAAVAIR
jgi:hypothetical protein